MCLSTSRSQIAKQHSDRRMIEVVPEKLRTLDYARPWRDDQFASTRLSSSRDISM